MICEWFVEIFLRSSFSEKGAVPSDKKVLMQWLGVAQCHIYAFKKNQTNLIFLYVLSKVSIHIKKLT